MDNRRYEKALAYLYSRQHFGVKLGLDNMRRLSRQLGDPHQKFPTVHIAGTNGKGSTSSFIAAILQAAGYRVGLLTSPHIADFRERIRVDGVKIDKQAVAEFIETYKPLIEKTNATFFEVATALTFWYFARKNVDWGVIEVGLGGRLDATNIITPQVSVITNIALEHTEILGNTIGKIAFEKGGIIKPGVPLITGVVDDGNDAARCFIKLCTQRGAPVYFHRPSQLASSLNDGHEVLTIRKGLFAGLSARLSLRGEHQIRNGFLAARVAEYLLSQGVRITHSALRQGLASNYWPARFMTVRKRPLVIVDAAHNPAGFETLAKALRRYYPGRKFDFLTSLVEKKRGDECLEIIAPLARSISTATMATERHDDPYHLISRLKPGRDHIRVYPDPRHAYKDLLENSVPSDILIITGSHFLIGELAPLLRREGF